MTRHSKPHTVPLPKGPWDAGGEEEEDGASCVGSSTSPEALLMASCIRAVAGALQQVALELNDIDAKVR